MAKANGKRRKISLALQGGGAHGAYTWGVLDRLSAEDSLEITAISATSAGALNAVAYAAGLSKGGPEGARKELASLWRRVSDAGSVLGTFGPVGFAMATAMQSLASPYDLNPFNFNPLRRLVEGEIDFGAVHASGLTLFVSATNVETGKVRVFARDEINADAVLASACLPQAFQAVEIDGAPYWDGGYMGNPSLFPLIYSGAPQDVLLVLLNPLERPGTPKRAADIQERLNEISFNASLIGELRAIAFVQRLIDEGMLKEPVLKKYRRLNIHAIKGGQDLIGLDLSSKYDTRWRLLTDLRDRGHEAADRWIETCAKDVGTKTSSFDIRKEFLEN
ncbi:MAG: patatin-like phospholipase family protein [Hyphomonas sp.]|uniref:patatin-like phospholipase family protein n=1 Tax=Hyphomonas sp. TaxID=87 RepID=UPI0017932EE0|nr:patatin-like phospholipase family protein [Hyphomonas sp.]MBU3920202.1 patatin-like phospholipase family protein [Alphaproteobacteria bacterium]MBA3069573.1 patatin-like phospholipase family protein [Hyphomonas sp.]MBU4063266.1 patatin-like phospholipase family protein [Alphaproteobacteria bacterium]MBU4164084.1 patatin-like phospholipase family protein [Alphaproteobacteria bacterium]MBU4569048.1 patatin-like phospholipase family protein [Alphaproteobacteria bacterium]